MASVDGSIEALSRAILAEADAETGQLKTQAQEKADQIRHHAQLEADRERKAILDQATQEADRLRSQAVASAQLKARALELEHRERLLNQVFSGVSRELPQVVQRKDFPDIAANLLREGLAQLRSDKVMIRADASTEKILTKSLLAEISREMHTELALGATLERGTGVVVQAAEGHLVFDNTLETRLARVQSTLRAGVYRVLMGEPQ